MENIFIPATESTGQRSNAEPITDYASLSGSLQRAAYQFGQADSPLDNSDYSDTNSGDGDIETKATPNMNWRSPYGGDVSSTFVVGKEEQPYQDQPWRKPYSADAPSIVSPVQPSPADSTKNNGNSSEIDPATGQPIIRNEAQTSLDAMDGQDSSPPKNGQGIDKQSIESWQQQAEIKRQRLFVDKALDYNTVGVGGNLIAGGIGGVVGARVVPWLMNKYTRGVSVDPDAAPETFRQKVTKAWRDNYDPNSWNGPDLEFISKQIDGKNGLAKQMADFNQPVQLGLEWRSQRATLFEPFRQVDTFADDVERARSAERAITANQQAIAAEGGQGKALFSTKELQYLGDLKKPGATMPSALEQSISRNADMTSLLKFRGDTFSTLSDPKVLLVSKSDRALSRLSAVNDALLQNEQVAMSGQKGLFATKELTVLKEYQGAASTALQATELSSASRFKSFIGDFGPSVLKGVGVAGSLMVVDHYADQLLFGKNHGNGIGDSINSALVPAALFIGPETSMWKIGLVGAGALVAGKLIGSSLSNGEDPSYSRYFNQSMPESLVLAAESLLPIKSAALGEAGSLVNWKRAALIAGTWLAFRGLNALFDPPSQSDTKDKAWGLLADDAKKRSDGSMNDAIDKFAALGAGDEAHGIMEWSNVFKEGMGKTKGARGEAALQVYRTEWLTKPTSEFGSMLEANRGAAILCTAFAESRLAHGTQVPTIVDTPTYLLEGKELDLGGKAARDFIIARINVANAMKQVQGNLGKDIAGKKVDQSEIADLDNVKKRIELDEAKIYGKHDMAEAVHELAKWGEGLNATHMAKREVDLRNTIAANQNSSDDRYKAKLFRDLATIYLSSAYAKQNGDPQSAAKLLGGDTDTGRQALDMTGQERGFDGALDCIARAAELDSNNPDLPQLSRIAQQINAELPGSMQKQMRDAKYNPLQIR